MPTPDQLAKALHPFLIETTSKRNLHEWGWYEYISLENHTSNDPVEVACSALLHLCVGVDGEFLGRHSVIVSVVNFANDRTGRQADAPQIQRLAGVFGSIPVRTDAVREWFDLVYR